MVSLTSLKTEENFVNKIEEAPNVDLRPDPVFLEQLKQCAKLYRKNQTKRKKEVNEEQQRIDLLQNFKESQIKEKQQIMEEQQIPEEQETQAITHHLNEMNVKESGRHCTSFSATPEVHHFTSKSVRDFQLCQDNWLASKRMVGGSPRAGDVARIKRRDLFLLMGPLHDVPDGYVTEFDSYPKYSAPGRCYSCKNWLEEYGENAVSKANCVFFSKEGTMTKNKLPDMPQKKGYPLTTKGSIADFQKFHSEEWKKEEEMEYQKLKEARPFKTEQTKNWKSPSKSDNDESVEKRNNSKELRRTFRERQATVGHHGCSDKCCRCNRPVYMAEKRMAAGKIYHKSCFTCFSCEKFLDTTKLVEKHTEIFCKACYFV